MGHIYKLNGLYYIQHCIEQFNWLTQIPNSDPYFILNSWTKVKFKEDILPLLKTGKITISKGIYDEIKNFKSNPVNTYIPDIEQLDGIVYKEHQEIAIKKMLSYNRYGFFLGTGTGKTIIALGFLKTVKPSSALIVTPQKVVAQYQSEMEKHLGPNKNYVVTNYEQLPKYLDQEFECLILDESHKAKSYTSNTNVNCRRIASRCKYVYLFTGTPQDKSRHEILAQLAILDLRVMPIKTKVLQRYFYIDNYYNPSREKREFSNELTCVINRYTWGKQTEDVITMMKENNFVVWCNKPKEYDSLLKNRLLKEIVNNTTYRCVADNKGVLKIKLRELCDGHILLEDYDCNTYHKMYEDSDKRQKLSKLLGKKVTEGIIYYEFDLDLVHIEETLKEKGITYNVLNGKTPKKQLASIVEGFKNGNFSFLVMQSKSGNAGLDLTNVNDIIFYALPESYIVFTQCKARINRIGQTKECNYWYLLCQDTVEEQIYESLNKKRTFTTRLFKIYS